MRSIRRPRYPVAKDCFPTTSTWYALPSQVHSARAPSPLPHLSNVFKGSFKRKLFAAKKVSHGYGSHVYGKKFSSFKANPQRLSLNKEDSIWFPHFLFVQIEFLHAHVTQDPSLPDVFYCSLIDWLNQANPLDQCTVNKDLYHIYHICQFNKPTSKQNWFVFGLSPGVLILSSPRSKIFPSDTAHSFLMD